MPSTFPHAVPVPPAPSVRAGVTWAALAIAIVVSTGASAQVTDPDAASAAEPTLTDRSLPLRTALHHDPTLEAPLGSLLDMFKKGDAVDDLVALYQKHIERWPDDTNARIVLLRIRLASSAPETAALVRETIKAKPEHPYFRYLLFEALRATHQPEALAALDKAIELQADPVKRRAWIDRMLPLAALGDDPSLLDTNLDRLAESVGENPAAALEAAAKMIEYDRYARALKVLKAAAGSKPDAETMVEIELRAADAEAALGRPDAAGKRLDRLIDRLAPEYWRRGEIVRHRLGLMTDPASRTKMLDEARAKLKKRPNDPRLVLELTDLLTGFERRREAAKTLVDASIRIPDSAPLESAAMAAIDELRDEPMRIRFLADRLEREPNRADLRFDYARSLFVLNRKAEATKQLDLALKAVTQSDATERLVLIGRELVAGGLTPEAVDVFERARALAPERLGLRRELGELYLALDRDRDVRRLFERPIPHDAPIEDLLDVARFLVESHLYGPAERALSERLRRESSQLGVVGLLLRVHAATGARREGEAIVERARRVADTPARYRQWLESAMAFYESFEAVDAFFDAEAKRITGGDAARSFDPIPFQRRMAFIDVADTSGRDELARKRIESELKHDPPSEAELALRRKLITLLSTSKDAPAIEAELKRVAELSPAMSDDLRGRMAVMHLNNRRHDLALPILAELDPAGLSDPAVLRTLTKYWQSQDRTKATAAMRRMIELAPADRTGWRTWLAALVTDSDEVSLRTAIRRLLAGVDNMPLSDQTREGLRRRLIGSYWRSIAMKVNEGKPAALTQALRLLDANGRLAVDDASMMWVYWTRAIVLDALDRSNERDAAVAELKRLAAAVETDRADGDAPGAPDTPVMVRFPDGMAVAGWAIDRAMGRPAPDPPVGNRHGPNPSEGRLAIRWAHRTVGGAAIAGVYRRSDGDVVIADTFGALTRLNPATGRAVWRRAALLPTPLVSTGPVLIRNQWGSVQQQQLPGRVSRPIFDAADRLYAVDRSSIVCIDTDEGRVLWRSVPVAGGFNNGQLAELSIFLGKRQLIAYDPLSHRLVRYELESGKLIDSVPIGTANGDGSVKPALANTLNWQNTGASRHGDRLLVYGRDAAIVDLESGRVEWTFEPPLVGSYPFNLEAPPEPQNTPLTPSLTTLGSPSVPVITLTSSRRMASFSRHPGIVVNQPQVFYVDPMTQRPQMWQMQPHQTVALSSPAVTWAAQRAQRIGILRGDHVLLMSSAGAAALPLDLPLRGTPIGVGGVYIGEIGRSACFLQGTQLNMVDTRTGATRPVQLSTKEQITSAVIDGPIVYAAGPTSIVAINAVRAQILFEMPLPESLHGGAAISGAYSWHGLLSASTKSPMGMVFDPRGLVADGVVYLSPSADRLIALKAPADGAPAPAEGEQP